MKFCQESWFMENFKMIEDFVSSRLEVVEIEAR